MKRTNTTTFSTLKIEDVEIYKENNIIKSVKIFDKIIPTISEDEILNEFNKKKYIRFIYLSLRHRKMDDSNATDEFFYIGQRQTNRKDKILSYFGSGTIVHRMYKEHPEEFEKCYLYICNSDDELNKKESELVNEKLIKMKPYCLNLQNGGNQRNWIKYKTIDEIKKHKEKFSMSMKQMYKDNPKLIENHIKFMKKYYSVKEHRIISGNQIKKWQKENPEKVKENLKKSRETFIKNHSAPVAMYDLDGHFIKFFNHVVDCGEYLMYELKIAKNKISVFSNIRLSMSGKRKCQYGYQFKPFNSLEECPYRIRPTYDINSIIVFTSTIKPIYIYHRISQLFNLFPNILNDEKRRLQGRITYAINKNIAINGIFFKRVEQFSDNELNNLIEILKNSKETDVLKFIDLSDFITKQSNPK